MIGVLVEGTIDPKSIMHRGMVVRSVLTGSRTMLEDLIRAIELHRINAVIDRVFAFDEAVEAYHYLESATHIGKVVIEFD